MKQLLLELRQNLHKELRELKPVNFLFLALAGCINAFGVTMFLFPVKLYDSGMSGLSMLLDQVTPASWSLPLFLVTIIQSMNVLLTLLWSVLFFHDPVTGYIIAGTVVFLIGMILVNWKPKRPAEAAADGGGSAAG